MNQDEEHLRLLSIFHYVVGGITGLFACFPFIHLAVGLALVTGIFPVRPGQEGMDVIGGWTFICVASFLILLGWPLAVAILVAGRLRMPAWSASTTPSFSNP